MFYAKSTGGFYDEEIHGDAIPEDAVEITREYHKELFEGQSSGKVISSDDKGFPILIAPAQPTPEQTIALKNKENRYYLNSTDWYVIRQIETGVAIPAEVAEKRAAARLSIVE